MSVIIVFFSEEKSDTCKKIFNIFMFVKRSGVMFNCRLQLDCFFDCCCLE